MESNNDICKQIDESLDAFRDGELSPAEAVVIEGHIKICAHCSSKLADIERVVSALKEMPREDVPAGFSSRLGDVIDRETKVVLFKTRKFKIASAVAAVAVVAFGVQSFMSQPSPTIAQAPVAQSAPEIASTDGIAGLQPASGMDTPTPLPDVASDIAKAKAMAAYNAAAHVDDESQFSAISKAAKFFGNLPHHSSGSKEPHTAVTIVNPQLAQQAALQHQAVQQQPATAAAGQAAHIASANIGTKSGTTFKSAATVQSNATSEEIAEMPTSSNSFTNAIGVSTDEDGLYDIQM